MEETVNGLKAVAEDWQAEEVSTLNRGQALGKLENEASGHVLEVRPGGWVGDEAEEMVQEWVSHVVQAEVVVDVEEVAREFGTECGLVEEAGEVGTEVVGDEDVDVEVGGFKETGEALKEVLDGGQAGTIAV